jgi:hypothetical protein
VWTALTGVGQPAVGHHAAVPGEDPEILSLH